MTKKRSPSPKNLTPQSTNKKQKQTTLDFAIPNSDKKKTTPTNLKSTGSTSSKGVGGGHNQLSSTTGKTSENKKEKNGVKTEVELLVLSDDDEEEEEDDLVIVESTSMTPAKKVDKGKGKGKGKEEIKIASIFSTPSSNKKPATPIRAKESEDDDDEDDVKSAIAAIDRATTSSSSSHPANPKITLFTSTSASTTSPSTSSSPPLPPLELLQPLATFSPSSINTSSWPNQRIPYSFITYSLAIISSTKKRLIIGRVLTNLFRCVIRLDPDSLLSVIYLCSNRLGPPHEPDLDLGVGSQVLSKVIKEVTGISNGGLKVLWNKFGDPGDVAVEASRKVRLLIKPKELVCHSLYQSLLEITKMKGTGSLQAKSNLIKKLLLATIPSTSTSTSTQLTTTTTSSELEITFDSEETRFLIRALSQNLRIGAVRTSLITALSRAFAWEKELVRQEGEGKEEEGEGEGEGREEEFVVTSEEKMILRRREERLRAKEKEKEGMGKIKGKGKGRVKTDGEDQDSMEIEEEELISSLVKKKLELGEKVIRKVWARHPDFSTIISALLSSQFSSLSSSVPLSLGTPLQPMLGSITRSLISIYDRLSNRPFVSEFKLDGQRGQIHGSGSKDGMGRGERGVWWETKGEGEGEKEGVWCRVFSRNLEDMTGKWPDLYPTLARLISRSSSSKEKEPLTSFIIDAEIVAIDPSTGVFRTFQELSYRSKKDVEMGSVKVMVGVYAFDLMFLNGKSLLKEPFRRRRELLKEYFGTLTMEDPRAAKWDLIPSCENNEVEVVKAFFEKSLEAKAEGIMVKLLDEVELDSESDEPDPDLNDDDDFDEEEPASPTKLKPKPQIHLQRTKKVLPASYEPDKRADSWLKVKKDYLDDLGDSLDLVPIGAWHGMGRKKDWWSPILMGCYDEDTGEWVAVCKIMSGFTDEFYKSLKERYAIGGENTSSTCYSEVNVAGVRPTIYFQPSEVWECRGADFTLSPVYPAAQGLVAERGISIRFPRYLRTRDPSDKSVENATTINQLADLYKKYADAGGKAKGDDLEEEDY